jgi:hypothetical protein
MALIVVKSRSISCQAAARSRVSRPVRTWRTKCSRRNAARSARRRR